jgi:hypothetical protein
MQAVVVYESHWGNTEAVARAIAEGYGTEAKALTTDEASPEVIAEAELIVAGAPVMGFSLPSERMVEGLKSERGALREANTSSMPMRTWLDRLPSGRGAHAAFETRIWWSPGGATGAIGRALETAGYRPIAKGHRFIVKDKYGPLRDGELENARQWGAELADAMRRSQEPTLVP